TAWNGPRGRRRRTEDPMSAHSFALSRSLGLISAAIFLATYAVPAARADDEPAIPASPAPVSPPPPAPPPSPAKSGAAAGADQRDWRTGDTLEIKVLAREDLSCTVRVLSDGTIDVPFAGRFAMAKRTAAEVKGEVEQAFAKIERNPQV